MRGYPPGVGPNPTLPIDQLRTEGRKRPGPQVHRPVQYGAATEDCHLPGTGPRPHWTIAKLRAGVDCEGDPPPEVPDFTLTSVEPTTFVATVPTTYTLTGTGFVQDVTVAYIGNAPQTTVVVSDTEIQAGPVALDFPAPITYSVYVYDGVTDTQPWLEISGTPAPDPPTITTITPNTADLSVPVTLTIDGTLFTDGDTLNIGTQVGIPTTFVSATQLTASWTPNSSGPKDAHIVSAVTGNASNYVPLTVNVPYVGVPLITSVTPNPVSEAGGPTTLVIVGNGYDATLVASFDWGASVPPCTFVSKTEIQIVDWVPLAVGDHELRLSGSIYGDAGPFTVTVTA